MSETPQETPEPPETPAPEPAEAPEPDAEPNAEPEPDEDEEADETPTPAGPSPEEIEARVKTVGRSFATYSRKVFETYDDQAHDLVECLLCPDMHKGFLNVNDAGRVPKEIVENVQTFLGIAREREYSQLPGFQTCTTCGGEGKGATGSHVPGKSVATCPDCRGDGYRGPRAASPNGHAEQDETLSGPLVHGIEPLPGDRDEWDQPRILPDGRENPNYGRTPKYWVDVAPWGETRGLTAQDAAFA